MQEVEFYRRLSPRGLLPDGETANRWTHACGCFLSLLGVALLMPAAADSGDPFRIAGCGVYSASLVALYAASTLSHTFEDPKRRSFYRMLDQVCIFLLVVGTYTPFGLVYAREGAWSLILIGLWLFALVGIALRVRRVDRTLPPLIYILMGWLPVPIVIRAYEVTHLPGILLIIGGGIVYTGGTWFLVNDHRHPYFHAAWHVCTIVGSALHFAFILRFVAPVSA